MIIRKYRQDDLSAMAELFYDTVHTICAKDYTKEQLDAWATGDVNFDEWNKSFLKHQSVVAEKNGIIIGFGDMDKSGYLDRLYVHKDYQGCGIASAVLNELEKNICALKFSTYASITARPFFEKRGYETVKENSVNRRGVSLTNYLMEKTIK